MSNVVDLSPTRRHVLEVIKRHGEVTPDELSIALGTSSSAVRQHLSALRSAGLVVAHKSPRREHGDTGRPADLYRATTLAEPLFATTADTLPIQLLEHMEHEDPALVGRVFDRRRRQMVDDADHLLTDTTVDERVSTITALLDEQGYLAGCEAITEGHFRINLHNCAIWAVANRFPQACGSELDYIRALVPDATVERITHKTSGAHTCAYDIRFDTQPVANGQVSERLQVTSVGVDDRIVD